MGSRFMSLRMYSSPDRKRSYWSRRHWPTRGERSSPRRRRRIGLRRDRHQEKRPSARVIACDLSRPALRVAAQNARRLEADVEFVEADLVYAFAPSSFDLVVSNPPYVPLLALAGLQKEIRSEPAQALFAGEDGLEVYGKLTKAAARALRPGGRLLMELGYTSRLSVEAMLKTGEWETPTVRTDLAGIDRMLAVRRVPDCETGGLSGGNAGK